MPLTYQEFLLSKAARQEADGFEPGPLHPALYSFQADIVRWALRRGRAAIFADCGMGKSFMQVEWARQVAEKSGRPVLIFAPLAVGVQTVAEAARLGVEATRAGEPSGARIQVTNYERLHKFSSRAGDYGGVVLDESSILKSFDGKTRTALIREFSNVPRRLCCTATPAPNDVSELANHAEFLGVMSRPEMLATFFVHDSSDGCWRLKGHASGDMWKWLATWSVFVRRPSDLGHADDGWVLPPLEIRDDVLVTGIDPVTLGGISGRGRVRKATIAIRVARAVALISSTREQWLVWCGLNAEGEELRRALVDMGISCVNVAGSDSEDKKVNDEIAWRGGQIRVLVTKPKIFGFGMNWQHCAHMLFLGLGDSYEQYYQAVRRCWRFGQLRPVEVVVVLSDAESRVADNVKRKEAEANAMAESIVHAMREEQIGAVHMDGEDRYEPRTEDTDGWALLLGDCVERIREIPDASVGLSIFSPPFASLYTYSASKRDLGNCQDDAQFFAHFRFLIPELFRVSIPGRRCAVHCQQLATLKGIHGYIGWRDFRGELIREFQAAGWIYDGEICIDKNPQAQAIRTKSKQLMFVQKERDSSWLRPGMADYVLLFRHPGDNPVPVKTDVTNEEWILFAHPIWYGISESDVLKYRRAREDEDEKHICPLQLETIERAVRLWTNPGEIVLSPFAGIGSEGYVARRFGRKFIGIELKESYFVMAVENLKIADVEGLQQPTRSVGLDEIEDKRRQLSIGKLVSAPL